MSEIKLPAVGDRVEILEYWAGGVRFRRFEGPGTVTDTDSANCTFGVRLDSGLHGRIWCGSCSPDKWRPLPSEPPRPLQPGDQEVAMSNAKTFTVPHAEDRPMPEYVSRHTGVTHIRIAASVPHGEQYRVTIEPVKSKRERKLEWLRRNRFPASAEEILAALDRFDAEDP